MGWSPLKAVTDDTATQGRSKEGSLGRATTEALVEVYSTGAFFLCCRLPGWFQKGGKLSSQSSNKSGCEASQG